MSDEIKYYGFMVNELDGSVDNLYCECEYKPNHEVCGLSFAKWFKSEVQRDKIKAFTIERIKFVQSRNKEIIL